MREAVIVEAVRTPLGRGKQTGALYPVHAVDLGAKALAWSGDRIYAITEQLSEPANVTLRIRVLG